MTGSVVHGICFHGIGTPRRTLEPGEERYWITVDAFHSDLGGDRRAPGFGSASTTGTHPTSISGWMALLERKLVASFFVIAGRLGSRGSLDADGLRELRRHGMTIGTHGMDHRPWRGLAPGQGTRAHRSATSNCGPPWQPGRRGPVPMGSYDRSRCRISSASATWRSTRATVGRPRTGPGCSRGSVSSRRTLSRLSRGTD